MLIGVNNNGEIVGLESDYKCLNKGYDKDMFELILRNAIESSFGTTFASRKIKTEFHEINEKEICKIDIEKNDELLFLEVRDKNDNKKKEAFTRVGNASKILAPEEIVKYSEENF